MKRLALATASLLCIATPAFAADLDGPVYPERRSYIERPAPPVVERYTYDDYYDDAPDVVVVPRVYGPRYAWRDRWYYRRHLAYGGWPYDRYRHRYWRHRHHDHYGHYHRRW